MWCSTCQQDVPGLGSTESAGELRCGKCGGELSGSLRSANAPRQATASDSVSLERALRCGALGEDDWALEAELRGVQRLMNSLKSRPALVAPLPAQHPPHTAPAAWHAEPTQPVAPQPKSHTFAWMVLSLGLAVFACGAVLLGWSLALQRDDLWPIGMPLALIGQAGLVLGLVLQLDGLWNSNRKTAQVLSELDGELKNVRQATSLLSTSKSVGGQSFYLHLAEGASPQLLLADLKGQMDLLAQQMARTSGK